MDFGAARDIPPFLSIVAVSRNDNHGGDMQLRMQHFIEGFIAQCKRHDLGAELILVEWNPPADRPPLEHALTWPPDFGPATVRIVTVPQDVHANFEHATALPLFQMIGKNVGIRRARGQYVLATNVDILFDDDLIRYMRDGLKPGIVLRVDRYDVPRDLISGVPFSAVLDDCSARFFQVMTRFGVFDVAQCRIVQTNNLMVSLSALFHAIRLFGVIDATRRFAGRLRAFIGSAVTTIVQRTKETITVVLQMTFPNLARLCYKILWSLISRGKSAATRNFRRLCSLRALFAPKSDSQRLFERSRWLHTNACGDFTLLAREDWFHLRGYPEWPMYSWHVDSVFMYGANAHGVREVSLGTRYRIYHINHGAGWSPEGAKELFERLKHKGIRYIDDAELKGLQIKYAQEPSAAIVNSENWGLADYFLPERQICRPCQVDMAALTEERRQ